jgi:protein gp37
MGTNSKIEWTDNTFNIVHGCTKVSDACDGCYAWVTDRRHLYSNEEHWGPDASRLLMSEAYWQKPMSWNRKAQRLGKPIKVFCSSMADVFEDHPQVEPERQKLWPLIEATPHLTWQLLTKRPHNILRMIPERWRSGLPANVWCMTTAETQAWFDYRAKYLLKVPAVVLGFSCEPLLSTIRLQALAGFDPKRLWIIAGGESGHKTQCRPTKPEWFAALRNQCQEFEIPFFFKQWGNRHEDGEYTNDKSYRLLDGREWNQFPIG